MTEHVRRQADNGVLTLTLNRADKKNALTNDMYRVLADNLLAGEADAAIRVIVFQAEGDMFTAGNDLGEFAAFAEGEASGPRHVLRFLEALSGASKPLVAAVQGKAVGVGTTMLLHCDQVVLAQGAQLSTPFVGLALVPEAASSLLLPNRIGHARAFAMFALGDAVSADDALAWGIANRVVPLIELRNTSSDIAERLARQPSGALRATKQLMRDAARIRSAIIAESEKFDARLQSAEALEAFTAFAERRQPDFSKYA